MEKVAVVDVDLAKSVFQVHGVNAEGHVVVQTGSPPAGDRRGRKVDIPNLFVSLFRESANPLTD